MKTKNIQKNLINNAWLAIRKKGRPQLNVRYLTKKSSCSIGGFYNVFKDIEDLMFHVNTKSINLLFSNLKKNLNLELSLPDVTLKTSLISLGKGYLFFAESEINLWKSLFETITRENLPEWYKLKIRKNLKEVEDILINYFNIPAEKIHRTITLFWAVIHGVSSIFINRKIYVIDDIIDDNFINFYLSHCIDGLI